MKVLYLLSFLVIFHTGHALAQGGQIAVLDMVTDTVIVLDRLNSAYRETNPCITPDGRYLFFMSGRGDQPWSTTGYTTYQGRQEADGDIYYSRSINGEWSDPQNLGPAVNSPMGEDEPNVTPDGQFVIFQSWKDGWEKTGGPYYRAELSGREWGKPEGLGGAINRFFLDQVEANRGYFATDGSTLSPDGRILIFAGGQWYDEPMDLYISFMEQGEWSYPEKMSLNTDADERSVFLAADSRTLFFSSSGYGGAGKLDIFKTVLDSEGQHGPIINLGPAFNGISDDYGFTMDVTGSKILYTRNAEMIQVDLRDPDRLLQPLPTLVINGIVTDYYGNPIEAEIRMINKTQGKLVARARSNAVSGEYALAIQKAGERYVKEVEARGFRPYKEEIRVEDPERSTIREMRDFLKRSNSELIFFDMDDPEIREGETQKLDSIVSWLFDHKRSRILLTGHADQPGTEEYNLELSEKRVNAVKTYLMDHGIPERIIRTRYFGEAQPLESHPLGEESQINRRVEVLILPAS